MVRLKRQSPTGPDGPPLRADRDGQTEQRILDAANAVFLRRGTAGARMQEIAQEAGVNHALLHYYFRSKARLAEGVFTRAAGALLPAVIGVLASDRALVDKVTEVVALEIDHLSKMPYLPAYIISELAHQPDRVRQLLRALTGNVPEEIGRTVGAVIARQIEEGVRAGVLRPIDPSQFIVNLLSLCIFPFAAKPMLMAVLGMDERRFATFVERRRVELPEFFLKALHP